MGSILKAIKVSIGLLILLVMLDALVFGMDTKTAYTRDGINFVSKERVDENIRYEYAKPGEYHEVQVPLNTVVVNASVIPELISYQEKNETQAEEMEPSEPLQTTPTSAREDEIKYPYATLGIGLLIIIGLIIFVAWTINKRSHQRK